jgi:hypothetical protein
MLKFNPIARLKNVLGIKERPPTGPSDQENMLVTMGEQNMAWTYYQEKMKLATDRVQRYQEFERMDEDDIPSSVLDLYSEDACQPNPHNGKTIWISSRNQHIQEMGEKLFDEIDAEEMCFSIARGLALYGDDINAILQERRDDGTPGVVMGLENLDPKTIWRHKDKYNQLQGFSRGPQPSENSISMPYDYLHFRLLGRSRRTDYGYSLLAPARRVYRQLKLMEDALVIYRLRRVPDRFVFKFNLGDMPLPQKMKYLNMYRQQIKKKMAVDPATGQIRGEMDPLSIDEDIFLDQNTASVERLNGMAQVNPVLDIDYMRKRFFGAVRVPADYMGFSDSKGAGLNSQSPLSTLDIQFARSVKKIQRAMIMGFARLFQISLCWTGVDPMMAENEFSVHMEPVSYLDEMYRSNVAKIRAETIVMLKDLGSYLKIPEDKWIRYVAKLSGFPEELFSSDEPENLGHSHDTSKAQMSGDMSLNASEREKIQKAMKDRGVTSILELVTTDPNMKLLLEDDIFKSEVSSFSPSLKREGKLPALSS